MTEADHYDVLGVEPEASRDEIRDAHRGLVAALDERLANPKLRDRQTVREEKAAANRAWTVLADSYQRERYDAERGIGDAQIDDDPEPETKETGVKRTFRERMRGNAERTERAGGRSPGPDAAPVLKRVAAAMMDVVVMGAFVLALASLVAASTETVSTGLQVAVVATIVVFVGVYNVVPVLRTGQTLGHRLMKLQVVDSATGALLDRSAAIRRYAIPVVLVALGDPFIMVALLLGLSFLFSQTRLSLLDRLARSRVVVAGGETIDR